MDAPLPVSGFTRPLFQLALDVTPLADALAVARRARPHVDILEAGTPLILEEGLGAVEALRDTCPEKTIVADLKIMDGGRREALSAFRRGAHIVTVLALADAVTIRHALEAAREMGGEVMVDLINTPEPASRVAALSALGVSLLCLHTANDAVPSSVAPYGLLGAVRARTSARLAVAGGIDGAKAARAVHAGADIVIVGGAVTLDADPGAAAARLRAALDGYRRVP